MWPQIYMTNIHLSVADYYKKGLESHMAIMVWKMFLQSGTKVTKT